MPLWPSAVGAAEGDYKVAELTWSYSNTYNGQPYTCVIDASAVLQDNYAEGAISVRTEECVTSLRPALTVFLFYEDVHGNDGHSQAWTNNGSNVGAAATDVEDNLRVEVYANFRCDEFDTGCFTSRTLTPK